MKTAGTKREILKLIKRHKRFLITSHINPEGDAIGSQLALAQFLKKMGKSVRIINHDPAPQSLYFLPALKLIEKNKIKPKTFKNFEVVIIVDCPSLERVGKWGQWLRNKFIINIDHHVSNKNFGDLNWVEEKASSAGEMIYELFKMGQVGLDRDIALALYVAIMTDTGSFRFSNTTKKAHQIIAELLEYNLQPDKIFRLLYETKSFATLKLLGEVLSNLKKTPDGKFVWFKLTKAMLKKYKLKEEDTEDFINFIRNIKTAEVVAFLRELKNKQAIKVSLRSKAKVNVNQIAQHFGGGGHFLASGCTIKAKLAKAERLLLKEIRKVINQQ